METQEILQVITRELGIAYYERGRNVFFSCPFHIDKTPSLSFSKEKKFFKCFSCDFKAKDVFTFWAKVKKVSLNKALEKFAELGYIDYTGLTVEEEETTGERILKLASEIYQHNLLTAEGSEQLNYLEKERKLDSTMIEQFALGTSISNNQLSKLFFGSKIFPISDLARSNLFYITDKKDGFDFFWTKQIIFPVNNEMGKLVSFASRNLNPERDGKYFFLSGSGLTQKSSLIYNYERVRELNEASCYLVEGFFDVISLTRKGFCNSLSTLGTSISIEQLKLLKKLEKKIIIFFDGDQAGVTAAVKAAALLILNDIDCEVIEQQGASDPDELCLQGEREINRVVRRKRSPIPFIIRYYFKSMQVEENPQRTKSFVLRIADVFSQFRRNVQLFVAKKISVITGMTLSETKEIYFSSSKQKFEIKDLAYDQDLNLLEEAVIYYSCRNREFWLGASQSGSSFSIRKNQNLWEIVNKFYTENSATENFNEFEKHEEFLDLPLFDENEGEKVRVLQAFTERRIKLGNL